MKIQRRKVWIRLALGFLVLGQGQDSLGMRVNKDGVNSNTNQKDEERKYEEEKKRSDNEGQGKNDEIKDEILNPQDLSSSEKACIKKKQKNKKNKIRRKNTQKLNKIQAEKEKCYEKIQNLKPLGIEMDKEWELNKNKRIFECDKLAKRKKDIKNIKDLWECKLEKIKINKDRIVFLYNHRLKTDEMICALDLL